MAYSVAMVTLCVIDNGTACLREKSCHKPPFTSTISPLAAFIEALLK